jgi:hypothetical protein
MAKVLDKKEFDKEKKGCFNKLKGYLPKAF